MNWRYIVILILFSIGIKISYLIFSYGVEEKKGDILNQYVSIVKKNDAYWYEKIAKNGYSEIRVKEEIGFSEGENFKQSEWAFFPFYPLLNAYTSRTLGVSYNISALIWSIIFSLMAIIGVYWFGLIFFKNQNLAFFNALVLFCFPFSSYFSFFYTESLYLSFLIFSFISIYYKRYLLLMFLLVPLTLIRPNGIIVLLPLYLYHLEQIGILHKLKVNWKEIFSSKNITLSLFFASAPLAFILYCIYQYKMTGFYFAFSIAQEGWYREFMFPILSFFRSGDFSTQFNSIFTIIVIIYAIWIRKKLTTSLNVLVFISLLLPLCSGSVISMTRFVSVIFPLFLILSLLINNLKHRYLILIAILGLHFIGFYLWLINNPISY